MAAWTAPNGILQLPEDQTAMLCSALSNAGQSSFSALTTGRRFSTSRGRTFSGLRSLSCDLILRRQTTAPHANAHNKQETQTGDGPQRSRR